MIKTILVITSLWGMWGEPTPTLRHHYTTPSSPGPQATVYHHGIGKVSSGRGTNWAKPSRWCGWYMRKRLGVSDARYNLARNWAQWGRPATPQIGAVVVWRHHVGLIVGQNQKGQWLIESGNDSNKVRVRPWNNLHKVTAYRI